ncbi:M protein repeat protein [Trichostrongylus colubriformis]|uniref:M protein repeat protein n=1 Tax=Trichostrongylus colubriformis TaxID=6319 RepID=A0AAN8F1I0_TRICO
METEQSHDYLLVFDNTEDTQTLAMLSGLHYNRSFLSQSNTVTAVFSSDENGNGAGFRAVYKSWKPKPIEVLGEPGGIVLITQRMLEFEKENGQLKRFVENGQQERADIMVKLKQLSAQIRTLTDENESNKLDNEVLKKELAEYKSNKEKMEKEMDTLNKALDQRPSEDDVAVLRTELVHAQKLMDEISQQKDVEISEHLNSIRLLNMEREKQRCVMENLQKQLEDTGSHSKESSELVRSLTSELEDTRQLLVTCQKDLEDAKSDSTQKGKRIEELHGKVEANLAELASCREKIAQLEETVRVSAREIDDSHAMNESNLKKLTQLSDKLEQVIEEKKRYETEMSKFEEKNDMHTNSIRRLELSNMDLTNELSSLGSLLEHERQLIDEKNSIIASKDQELFSLREDLERSHIDNEKLKSQCESRANESESLAKQLLALQENSKELMDRISKGEDGSKAAIEQLKIENQKLQEEIGQLTASFQEEKNGLVAKANEQEKVNREERKNAAEKLKQYEHQKETLERRLREAEDEVSRKAERFVEMEKEIEDDRRIANERVQKLKEIIRVKEASISEARKQLEELSTQLTDKNRLLREKEHQVEENRRKIEESVNRIAEAEAKARNLEAELSQSEAQRLAVTDSESDLRTQLSDNEALLASFKQQVEKVVVVFYGIRSVP